MLFPLVTPELMMGVALSMVFLYLFDFITPGVVIMTVALLSLGQFTLAVSKFRFRESVRE